MKSVISLICLMFIFQNINAQSVTEIHFSYDVSGNQISKHIIQDANKPADNNIDLKEISFSEKDHIQMYPIPVQDILNIRISDELVENCDRLHVFDSSGKLLFVQSIIGQHTYVNMQQLPAGVYFLVIELKEQGQIRRKIIKK